MESLKHILQQLPVGTTFEMIIKVRINADVVTATEINTVIMEDVNDYRKQSHYIGHLKEWEEAENKLRTFNIDFSLIEKFSNGLEKKVGFKIPHFNQDYKPNSIHSAEILDNDKLMIRIL